jgi:hypothetical protein
MIGHFMYCSVASSEGKRNVKLSDKGADRIGFGRAVCESTLMIYRDRIRYTAKVWDHGPVGRGGGKEGTVTGDSFQTFPG